MIRISKKFHLIYFLLAGSFFLFINAELIGQSLNKQNIDAGCSWNQPEKVFVHLAQNIVSAGEQLPFKAYIVNSKVNTQAGTSAVLYCDILDSHGNSLLEWRSNATDGLSSGYAIIPDTLKTGLYIFRAYTRWMINWGNDFVFQTPLLVMNYADDNISSISTLKYPGKNGKDSISQKNNPSFDVFADISSDSLTVRLISDDNSPIPPKIDIKGYLNGELLISKKIRSSTNNEFFQFNLKGKENGIISLIVLDERNTIIKEKQLEYTQANQPALIIKPSDTNYKQGENIIIDISNTNMPVEMIGQYSCTVRRQDSLQVLNYTPTITNYLNGYSEFPASDWYNSMLESKDEVTHAIFSWKLAVWNKAIDTSECRFLKENNKFLLSGRITSKLAKNNLSNIPVLLSVESSYPSINYCFTNSKGEFFFWLKKELDDKTLILQTIDDNLKNTDIQWEIYSGLKAPDNFVSESENLTEADKRFLKQFKSIELINHIYYPNQELKAKPSDDSAKSFIITPSYTIYPNDYNLLTNFKEIAENILPAVTFKEKKDAWYLQIYDPKEEVMLKPQGMVLLNGVPFTNLGYIASLPIEKIEHIDVFTSQIIYGRIDLYGLVAIYTFDKKLPADIINKETFQFKNTVLAESKEIFSGRKNKNEKEPDFRNLLYWNPDLIVKSGELKTLEFPASQSKGTYIIEIQGISNDGHCQFAQSKFTIE